MSKVFIIAEAACTWLHGGLEAAYRSIQAAKECGADAWKTQWTSDPLEMGKRRGMDGEKYRRLAWPADWHASLKAKCEEVGVEYMCTVFIPKDVQIIAPYVKRFKVSAYDSGQEDFMDSHHSFDKQMIVSKRHDAVVRRNWPLDFRLLYCMSEYPTKLESLRLHRMDPPDGWDGLSDHTTSVLTGAVAVGAGARIIEKHVRLMDTPKDDPDWGHSLPLDKSNPECFYGEGFSEYVDNIREAERML